MSGKWTADDLHRFWWTEPMDHYLNQNLFLFLQTILTALHTNNDDSKIADFECGEQKITIICPECNMESVLYDKFNCLNVPIAAMLA